MHMTAKLAQKPTCISRNGMHNIMKAPYYKQTTGMTCGAAALMMLLKFYDKKFKLDRENEFKIWRDSILMSWRASGLYGLATVALKHGYKVTLLRQKRTVWQDIYETSINEQIGYIFKQQEAEAKKLGLRQKIVKINIKLLRGLLKKGIPPMVLIREIKPHLALDFAHWVIVLGIDKNFVYINDSMHGKNRQIPLVLFERALDTLPELKCGFDKEVLVITK